MNWVVEFMNFCLSTIHEIRIVPFHGQGMNCGFEDVSCFMQQLQESGDSTTQAFTKTAELRKPNGDAIADLALENYVEMRADVRDPKYLLKKSIAFALEKKYPSRFVPRYSLVMFHHIPYAKAKSVGIKQDRFLSDLVKDIQTIEELDWQKVDEVMTQEFTENIIFCEFLLRISWLNGAHYEP